MRQFHAYQTSHQLAAAHTWEPRETTVGFLPLAKFFEGAADAVGYEVLVEEVDELCTAFGIAVGFAQPGCLGEEELLEVGVGGEGAGLGGRTAKHTSPGRGRGGRRGGGG